ncbi:hypothetical protein TNCV_1656111 [Trichonephila clavipes]|nr:hypothetical protein TNCV_1656111 [Trichonephila clavipes]
MEDLLVSFRIDSPFDYKKILIDPIVLNLYTQQHLTFISAPYHKRALRPSCAWKIHTAANIIGDRSRLELVTLLRANPEVHD